MIGQTISHYRILSQLGGGRGVLYEAENTKLRRWKRREMMRRGPIFGWWESRRDVTT